MIERTKRRMKMAMGAIRTAFSRHQPWCLLDMLVLGVCCLCVSVLSGAAKKAGVYPPQEVAVKSYGYHLLGRIEESLSFSPEWPDKDKYTEASKRWRERYENLEYRFGPVEIGENETLDKATRVVLPTLSMSLRNLSTGEIIRLPRPGVPEIAGTVLEKRDTPTGPRWYIISEGPGCAELDSSGWLKLPRKKVPDAPTIILRKAVVVQFVSDGQVVNERIIFADPNSK
jgi:hypothetical protein